MILQPTPNNMLLGGANATSTNGQRTVDLNAAGGWSELIGEIVRIANSGGGRVEVRCAAEDETLGSGRVFSARVDATGPVPGESRMGAEAVANLKPVRI